MKINLVNEASFIEQNKEFITELGFEITKTGESITLSRSDRKELVVIKKNNSHEIRFNQPVHIFRGLLLWKNLKEGETLKEVLQFSHMGPMVDLSRNAVLSISGFKNFLKKQARLGLDRCMLYMEDTFEVRDYPYFGHFRGRYTVKELQELDQYAQKLGIELIPSIQTLGHLKNPMKWDFLNDLQDTEDILLVGEEKTYTFIEALIKTMKEAFQTKKIHIGMDEAWTLGSGQYLKKHGYHTQFDIMTEHLGKVLKIVEKYDLEPLMWSDMFYRATSKTGDYYDPECEITPEMIEKIPAVELTLWDYYHTDQPLVEKLLASHFTLSKKVSFAGGVWTWNGIAPNYGKTLETTRATLSACKKMHVEDIYITLWGDDGQETSIDAAWFGLAFYAHYLFNEQPSLKKAEEEFALLLNENAEDYLLLNEFDETPGISKDNLNAANPSKLLLYQDVLLDLFAPNFSEMSLKKHYTQLTEKLKQTEDNLLFAFYQKLAKTLAVKAGLAEEIRSAYEQKSQRKMAECINTLAILKEKIKELKKAHYLLWHKNYKTFGWEVLDVRYGGLLSRIETVSLELTLWQEKKLTKIEPLETPLLPYDRFSKKEDAISIGFYENIITPSKLSGV